MSYVNNIIHKFSKILIISLLPLICFIKVSYTDVVIQLPKTGQTTCYDSAGNVISCVGTGQDGEIKAGVAWPVPRFTNNGDATVTDNLTGLMWTQDANLPAGTKTWQEALDYVAGMNAGTKPNFGFTDWRLPNINELESLLINAEEPNPETWLIIQGFINVQRSNYWSSTHMGNSDAALTVSMTGHMTASNISEYVWPVRSGGGGSFGSSDIWKTGQTTCYDSAGNVISCVGTGQDGEIQAGVKWPVPRFTDNRDATVTDNLTGLMWTQDANLPAGTKTWQEALDYVAGMNAGTKPNFGFTDWRLPNRKELFSLLDRSQSATPLPTGHHFTNVQWDVVLNGYWTSTNYAINANSSYRITWIGHVWPGSKDATNYVWPVRTAEPELPDTTPPKPPAGLRIQE